MHIQACLFRSRSARRAVLPVVFCCSLIFSIVFLFTTCRTSAAETAEREKIDILLAMNLEELMKMEVITASKRSQKIVDAPSPIHVFTAEDIQRTGVRSIMELVKFIPGFYVYPRLDQTFIIANRGIRTGNDTILYLLDGIPLNNNSQGGSVNAHIFPGLDMVKRVEVISGPGSTMWGSDATLGVINIITKDGQDIDGNIISGDVATEDNHRQFNFLSGKKFDRGEYMVSATFAQNDGFGNERHGFKNYVHDFNSIPWNDDRANFNHIYPSYEILGKLRIRDFTFKALFSEKSIYSFWNTSQSTHYRDMQDKEAIHTSKDIHLELSHHAVLSDRVTLDTKLTAHKIDYVRDKVVEKGYAHGSDFIDDPNVPNAPDGPDVVKPPIHDRMEKFPEKGAGLEFILNWDINEKNKLLAGTSIRVTDVGPGEFIRFNVNTGEPPPAKPAREILYKKTTDRSYGVYVEDTYYATDKLTLIGGVRIDYNEPREEVMVIMPRGAVIYEFTDAVSLKYMYNTGYVRPPMAKSFEVALTKAGSVRESQKIRSHDAVLTYTDEKTQLIVDAFYMTVYDLYAYDANQDSHVNQGDIFTKGLQLSLKRRFLDGKLLCDLNYGYARAKKEDKFGNKSTYHQGVPDQVYAAGVTYLFTDKISLNANVAGWSGLKMNNVPATSWYANPKHPEDYDGEYVVNLNLRFAKLLHDHLDVSLYVLNALDEDVRLQALDDWHAWWSYDRGRSVGIKASWKF